MASELRKAKKWLHGADHICILSHVSPDGDAVGSVLGLTWALRAGGTVSYTHLRAHETDS